MGKDMYFHYETERLVLKVLGEDNGGEVLDFYRKGDAYFGSVEPERMEGFYTESYQRYVLKYEEESFLAEKSARYYIFLKNNMSRIIGTVALRNIVKGSFLSATIGYKLLPEYTGRGVCTEAVRCITDSAIQDSGLHRIVAYVQPDNAASISVLTRCGYKYEGIAKDYVMLNGRWQDHAVYARING